MTLALDRGTMATSISVSEEMADWLHEQKGRGDTYEDVLCRLIREEPDEDALPAFVLGEATPEQGRDAVPEPATPTPDAPADADLDRLVDDVVDAGVLPGSGAKLQRRRDALHVAVDFLREQGTATPADFKESVYPDHSADYGNGNSWWKNCIYKGLSAVAEQSDAVEKADYSGEWRYVG